MLLFDIGANRGEVVHKALSLGYTVVAVEPAPKVFALLIKNYAYNPKVIPLKAAVSNVPNQWIKFYEAAEDGLSTINIDWLTKEGMPYNGVRYNTIGANTITIDWLVERFGMPDLVKIDVEGAESLVFEGMTCKPKELTFEWSLATLDEHLTQLERLRDINGYTKFAPQFIVEHLDRPKTYYSLKDVSKFKTWLKRNSKKWEESEWKVANLRPTADVGMCWVK